MKTRTKTAHDYGKQRGRQTARSTPTDRDWAWLANESDGRIQGTDPQEAVDFEAGMREGAGVAP